MFGYIRPCECELKVREQTLYRAYYCGLCQCIGKECSQRARVMLDYDCAFLGMLLSIVNGNPGLKTRLCPIKPIHGKQAIAESCPELEYAAHVNVLLGYWKLCDDWKDERKVSALVGKWLTKSAYKKAGRKNRELFAELDVRMREFSTIEQQRQLDPDLAACAFGKLMEALARYAPSLEEDNRKAMEWMLFNLGRWIYLMDAWEDRERDKARGTYNPFVLCGASREDAAFQLNISLMEAVKAYDLMRFRGDSGILDNIMRIGLWQQTQAAMNKERLDESL